MTRVYIERGRKVGKDDAAWRALSGPMQDRLGDLHLARLNKERGRRASIDDRTLLALYRRGLAVYRFADDGGPLWSLSDEGKRLWMRFG